MASKTKLDAVNIPTMTERPVEGCKNVKDLVKKWAAEKKPQAGQIEIVFRGSRGNSKGNGVGAHNSNNAVTKPVVYIGGNYYQVPQNDLFTTAKGGIALPDSPYAGYTKKAYKDKKHADIVNKLKVQSSVVTEEVNFFDY